MAFVACLVCKHSKRFDIETALKSGTPKLRIAKTFGVRRASILDHVKNEHEKKDPAKPPEVAAQDDEIVDPFPSDFHVRLMTSRAERMRYVERTIDDRRFYGSETIAKLARIWSDILGKDATKQVAEMFADVIKRRVISGGSKDLRKKFAMAELLSMYRECRESGDRKTALSAFERYIELDNLNDEPSLDRAVLVQIVQLIKHEAPHLERRVEEHLAQFEIVVDQAKAVLEGEIPPETKALSPKEEPIPEAPPTPRSSNTGIDTAIPSSEEPSSE
jgi:hypothetical protein